MSVVLWGFGRRRHSRPPAGTFLSPGHRGNGVPKRAQVAPRAPADGLNPTQKAGRPWARCRRNPAKTASVS